MSNRTKTLGLALLLCSLLLAIWLAGVSPWWSAGSPPPKGPDATVAPAHESAPLPAAAPVERVEAETAPAAPDPAEPAPTLPFAFDVSISVSNADDVPARRARVLVAPLGLPLHSARTDGRGVVRLRFRGRRPSVDLAVSVGDEGLVVERVTVLADQPVARSYRVDARQGPRAPGQFSFVLHAGGSPRWPDLSIDDQGWCRFGVAASADEGRAETSQFMVQDARIELSGLVFGTLELDSVISVTSGLAVEDASIAEQKGIVEGIAYAAGGAPAADALVCVGRDEWSWTDRTDDRGRFRLEVPAGTWRVRVGGGTFGVAESELSVAANSVAQWSPRLDRGAEVRGRLVDEAGDGLSDYRIDLRSADGLWMDRTRTGADGAFAVPSCPPGQLIAEAIHPDGGLPQHEFYLAAGGHRDYVLPSACVARASIAVRPSPFSHVGRARVSIWLWQGVRAQVIRATNDESLGGTVAPGTYAVELRGLFAAEPRLLGMQEFAADQAAELGAVMLPELAVLSLEGEGWGDVEWQYEHAVVDARGSIEVGGPRVVLPGRWHATRSGASRIFDFAPGDVVLGADDLPR